MDSESIIDRKRLERYPLAMDPWVHLLLDGPFCLGTLCVLFALNGFMSALLQIPPGETMPAADHKLYSVIYGNPWLAVLLGLAFANLNAYLVARSSTSESRTEAASNVYFLTRNARLQFSREANPQSSILPRVFSVIFQTAALVGLCILLRADLQIAVCSFALGALLTKWRVMRPAHKEILCRRRIALAWEGGDPPKNNLTLGQTTSIVSLGAGVLAFLCAIGALMYTMVTEPTVTRARGLAEVYAGSVISTADAEALEHRLAKRPADYDARMKLLGYYSEHAIRAKEAGDQGEAVSHLRAMHLHARYFVEHVPGHGYTEVVCVVTPFRTDDSDYLAFSDLWREQVDQHPTDPDVLWNAAIFFDGKDDHYRWSLLERGCTSEPNDDRWTTELSDILFERLR